MEWFWNVLFCDKKWFWNEFWTSSKMDMNFEIAGFFFFGCRKSYSDGTAVPKVVVFRGGCLDNQLTTLPCNQPLKPLTGHAPRALPPPFRPRAVTSWRWWNTWRAGMSSEWEDEQGGGDGVVGGWGLGLVN